MDGKNAAAIRSGWRVGLAVLITLVAAPVQAWDGSPDGYQLVWNDEFDVDGLTIDINRHWKFFHVIAPYLIVLQLLKR